MYVNSSLHFAYSTWSGFINSLLMQAAKDPYTFLFYVLVFLSPFFLASAVLSYKLSRAIEKQEKDMKKKKGAAPKRPKKD